MVYLGHVPWLIIPYQVGRWKGSGCAKKPSPFHVVSKKARKGEDREVDPLMIVSAVSRDTSLSDHVHRRSPQRLGQARKAASESDLLSPQRLDDSRIRHRPRLRARRNAANFPSFLSLGLASSPLFTLSLFLLTSVQQC